MYRNYDDRKRTGCMDFLKVSESNVRFLISHKKEADSKIELNRQLYIILEAISKLEEKD